MCPLAFATNPSLAVTASLTDLVLAASWRSSSATWTSSSVIWALDAEAPFAALCLACAAASSCWVAADWSISSFIATFICSSSTSRSFLADALTAASFSAFSLARMPLAFSKDAFLDASASSARLVAACSLVAASSPLLSSSPCFALS